MAPLWSRRSWDWLKPPDLGELGRSVEQIGRSFGELGRSVEQIGRSFGEIGQAVEQISRIVGHPGERLRRLHADRDAANSQLRRLHALPAGRRRKTERLAAYCPRGCQVVAVYAVSGTLLLDLRSDLLITGETFLADLPDGRPHPRGTRLPHRGHWVTDQMAHRRWMVDCDHAAYPVAGVSLLALLPVTGRATVDVSALAPGAAC